MKSQNERILAWLKRGFCLTPIQAFKMFDCLALHSRCSELRGRGHRINTRMVKRNGKRVGEYSLA